MQALSNLKQGHIGMVKELTATSSIRRRLLDIGLVNETFVECIQASPFGDPVAYLIRGAVIALRSEDSNQVLVECIV